MGLFNLHKKPLSKALKTISHEQQQKKKLKIRWIKQGLV